MQLLVFAQADLLIEKGRACCWPAKLLTDRILIKLPSRVFSAIR